MSESVIGSPRKDLFRRPFQMNLGDTEVVAVVEPDSLEMLTIGREGVEGMREAAMNVLKRLLVPKSVQEKVLQTKEVRPVEISDLPRSFTQLNLGMILNGNSKVAFLEPDLILTNGTNPFGGLKVLVEAPKQFPFPPAGEKDEFNTVNGVHGKLVRFGQRIKLPYIDVGTTIHVWDNDDNHLAIEVAQEVVADGVSEKKFGNFPSSRKLLSITPILEKKGDR